MNASSAAVQARRAAAAGDQPGTVALALGDVYLFAASALPPEAQEIPVPENACQGAAI
jgi:hypothetical protein